MQKSQTGSRFVAVALIAALILIVGCSSTQPAQAPAAKEVPKPVVIKIGGLVPINGPAADSGNAAVRGMEQAVREINAAGGIKSMGGATLELVKEDLPFAPDQAAKAAEKLLTVDKVAAIIGGIGPGAAPSIAAAQRVPGLYFDAIDTMDVLVQQGYKHYFQMSGTFSDMAATQVAFLANYNKTAEPKLKKAVALHYDDSVLHPMRDTWVKGLKAAGIEVAEVIAYPGDWADPAPYVNKIKALNADLVIAIAFLPHSQALLKGIRQAGIRPVVMNTIIGFMEAEALGVLGDLAEGGFSGAFWNADLPESQAFIGKFKESNPKAALDGTVALHYQAMKILAQALEQSKSTDVEKLSAALRTVQVPKEALVLASNTVAFDQAGLNSSARHLVVQVQKGQYKTVWPEDKATAKPVKP